MVDDRIQYAITQYLDGTLPPEERADLEKRLAADAEARQLLEEYRRLDGVLKAATPLPPLAAINWDRLHEHLSAVVADQEAPAVRTYSLPWAFGVRRLAIAASVALLVGAGAIAYLAHRAMVSAPPTAVADVRVLQTTPPAGPAILDVSFGPAPQLAGGHDTFDSAGIVTRPSSVTIAANGQLAQDTLYQRY